ncbi:MAG: hypothetical protein V4582_07190 [Pseudomonadota bacterium]
MKIYGKPNGIDEEPVLLHEATLVITREEVGELLRFLTSCSDDMASNPDWEHAHLRDFLGQDDPQVDLIVFATH